MTALAWDQIGERKYQTGIDRGVLYLHEVVEVGEESVSPMTVVTTKAVPWNGLLGVEESASQELKSYYLDGVKYLENLTPGDFQGKLKAYTYPDEFDAVNGIATPVSGLSYYEQPPKSFNLSYRTRVGNDVDGTEHGYKIHILYNLLAVPEGQSYDTIQGSDIQPVEFGWSLTGTPPKLSGLRPTVHISVDSTKTPPEIMKVLEDILYGTDTTEPDLPPITEIGQIFGFRGALVIINNGDGSWTAFDESDTYITMIDPTNFQIDGADATYLDPVTYTISSTNYGAHPNN